MKKGQNTALDASEQSAVETVELELSNGRRLYIVPQTKNVLLQYFHDFEIVPIFLDRVHVLESSKYYTRWARRLQSLGFTREDARVLSHGTFGTDNARSFVGVNELLTFDKPLVNLFNEKQNRIQQKLNTITQSIEPPYDQAKLPNIRLLSPTRESD